VEEMIQKAQGTWIFPTIVIGEEVELGFDPEWMQTHVGKYTQGVCTGGNRMTEPRGGTRNDIVERLARAQLSSREDDTRRAILRAFAKEGSAPHLQDVAHVLGLPIEPVREACRTLARHDLILWREDEARIISAYPFSGVPTAHQVLIDGGNALYAMCAIDALGIPFMLGQGVCIRSACFFCQQPVTVEVHGGSLQGASPPTTVVWFSEREGCCVAETRCPLMNFFCHEGHLHAWLITFPDEQGTALSVREALDVGKAVFGELLT
jgi:Alkylmercury lyase